MNVIDDIHGGCIFKDVEPGECFRYGGKTYLKFSDHILGRKLRPIYDQHTIDYELERMKFHIETDKKVSVWNAVCFQTGCPGRFKDDTAVNPLPEAVVISGYQKNEK